MATSNFYDDNIPITKRQKIVHNIPPEEDKLKFDFVSLRKISRAKIVSCLWMNTDIQKKVTNLMQTYYNRICYACEPDKICLECHNYIDTQWKHIDIIVSKKASQLCLPKFIVNNELMNVIKPVGNSMRGWILYLDCYILDTIRWKSSTREHISFESDYLSRSFAVDFIESIKWTIWGKIDFQQTIKCILAKENNLSIDCKFKLACNFCLEDVIADVAPNVTLNFLNTVDIRIQPMVHYWTWTSLVKGSLGGFSRYEYFRMLLMDNSCTLTRVNSFNEAALKYLWDKLSKDVQARCIETLVLYAGNHDLKYFVLSNLEFKQQQKIFLTHNFHILSDILNDWFLEEQFLPTAFRLYEVMDSKYYFLALQLISKKVKDSVTGEKHEHLACKQWKLIFKQYWLNAPQHLRDSVIMNENLELHHLMTCFSYESNIDIIQFLLTFMPLQKKKEVIYHDWGLSKLAELIINGQWDILNMIINTLSSEEAISELKQRIVQYRGRCIANKFKQRNERVKMEYFLKWAFKSDKEKNHFKQSVFPLQFICTRRTTLFKQIV